jgi:hypothetical protein
MPRTAQDFVVARGRVATVEIGVEAKILAKAMIKQIDRVINDLVGQVGHFKRGLGNPICVGIVGINQAEVCTSYEGKVNVSSVRESVMVAADSSFIEAVLPAE